MASSKQKYGEELIKLLNGGNYTPDSKITLRQAMLYVSQARDKLVRNYLWNSRDDMDDFIYGGFITSYTVVTAKDVSRNSYYATLPVRPIWLPNNEGIFQVGFPQDEVNSFIPMPTGAMQIYGSLDSSFLEGNIGYYPEKDRIYLYGLEESDCELLVKIIPAGEDLGDLDYFPIAPDLEMEMMQEAMSIAGFQRQQKQDTINDNADT